MSAQTTFWAVLLLAASTSAALPGPSSDPTWQEHPAHRDGTTYELRLLSYNAFLRPRVVEAVFGFRDHAQCRAPLIADRIRNGHFDIVALQETQHEAALDRLVAEVKQDYPYRLLNLPGAFGGLDTRPVDGGVSILSRYPIEKWTAVAFSRCRKEDCLAHKGFVHAVVKVDSKLKLNVIATHMNSGGSAAVRHSQLGQIRKHIAEHAEFKKWPTFILGDLNINGLNLPSEPDQGVAEYRRLMRTLSLPALGSPKDAFVVRAESRAHDSDVSNTRNCTASRIDPCVSPNARHLAGERRRHDYVLYYEGGPFKVTPSAVAMDEFADASHACNSPYLSDHKAATAEVVVRRVDSAGDVQLARVTGARR